MSEIDKVRVNRTLTLGDAAAFHGHEGPFLIVGYRAGKFAVDILKPETEFDLEADVYIPFKTPFSCILDGLQCSTKCTWGKRNIRCYDNGELTIKIKNKKTEREIIMKLREEYVKEFLEKPIEEAAIKAKTKRIDELFEIEITR